MSREFQVTIDAHDPAALSRFWRDVLGYVIPGPPGVELEEGADPLAAWNEFLAGIGVPPEHRNTRSALEDPDGRGPRLFFQQVPEAKAGKNRLHLDIRVVAEPEDEFGPDQAGPGSDRMTTLEAEADRLVALGARRLRREDPAPPMTYGHIVMADPEGNEFCLD